MTSLVRALALAGALCAAPVAAIDYPPAPRGPVVDDYFGTRVADPWRWLEDTESPATRAWVAAQNALSLPYLAALPERAGIARRLAELWDHERYELPVASGGRLFYRRNDGLQNQSVLYVQEAGAAAPRVLLDPNTLAADGTVALTQFEPSPDGRWLAWGSAAAGSDWNEFRVRAIDSGEDAPERLTRIKFSTIAWTRDGAGFFYSRYPEPPAAGRAGVFDDLANQALWYHRVGTPQAEDRKILDQPGEPKWTFAPWVGDDGRLLAVRITRSTGDVNALWVKDLGAGPAPDLDAPWVKLVQTFDHQFDPVASRGTELLVMTNAEAPRGRIAAIRVDADTPAWRTRIAERRETLQAAIRAGDGLAVLYLRDARSQLRRHALDGRLLGDVALPGLGSIPDLSVGGVQLSGSAGSRELYYGYTSFNQPLAIRVVELPGGRQRAFKPVALAFDPADYVTEQVFFTSRDGTRVPMFISHRRGLKRDGRNPTLLHGYGGFNVPKTPQFDVSALAWMERGGVYAVANLRGGGEYGRAWHEAGILGRKQNVFDDVVGAAGYLISRGWTSSEHLALWGRSNGGLLVGAVVNQHPQLFAAAAATVGVMDMLRYHRFTIGWAWATDYGTSATREGFDTLRAYSPYHNVRAGERYPPMLVMTGDHDDRVVPGHSYKYTAALQAAQGAPENPVLARIDVKTGHGGGKPVSKLIAEEADKLAFLWHFSGGSGKIVKPGFPPARE